jgi:hypothetical protein
LRFCGYGVVQLWYDFLHIASVQLDGDGSNFVNMEYLTEPSCKGKLLLQLAHVQEQLNI